MAPLWFEEIFCHADLGPLIFDSSQMGIIRRNRLAQTCKELYRRLLSTFLETANAMKASDREHVVAYAATMGLKTVVMEAHLELECPLKFDAGIGAALKDHDEVLAFVSKLHPKWPYRIIPYAAREGSAKCLDFALRHHNSMVRGDAQTLGDSVHYAVKQAAINNHSAALRVFYQFGFQMTKEVAACAVRNNAIEALTAMLSMNVVKDIHAVFEAAGHRTDKMLKFLHESGWPFPLDNRLPGTAAFRGSIECLKYLKRQGFDFDLPALTANAAQSGSLEVLVYLRDQNVPWGDRLVEYAVCNGHVHILEYALSNGCPCDFSVVRDEWFECRSREFNSEQRRRMDHAFFVVTRALRLTSQ